MNEVYVLVKSVSSDIDHYEEYEIILGIFTSRDLAINSANNYITKEFSECMNEVDKSCYFVPDKPLLFEDIFLKEYTYMNNNDWFTNGLIIRSYILDTLEDN